MNQLFLRRFSTGGLKVGLVGSGPAAFYTAKYLLKEIPKVQIDMFDKLPTPYGLVRTGVAPDHPEVKIVQNDFHKVACSPGVRFFGNVEVGNELPISQLQQHYSALVLAYGAGGDRRLNIPGEKLGGVYSAREFVNWYNGHPEFSARNFDLSSTTCCVIGQGNVAVDVARLLCSPLSVLQTTDIAQHALEAFGRSRVSEVHLVGRRGPAQAAFTTAEVRELFKLPGCATMIPKDEFELGKSTLAEMESSRAVKRKVELLREIYEKSKSVGFGSGSGSGSGSEAAKQAPSKDGTESVQSQPTSKSLYIRFYLSPKEILEDKSRPGHVGAVVFERTRLIGEPNNQYAEPTGERIVIPTGCVLKSVGYQSLEMPGVPFDSRKMIVPSKDGRVTSLDGSIIPGLYVSGWIKRGPMGNIGSNIGDAKETVKSIVSDVEAGRLKSELPDIEPFLKQLPLKIVDNSGWSKIDQYEQSSGSTKGKPREKLVNLEDILRIAHEWKPT